MWKLSSAALQSSDPTDGEQQKNNRDDSGQCHVTATLQFFSSQPAHANFTSRAVKEAGHHGGQWLPIHSFTRRRRWGWCGRWFWFRNPDLFKPPLNADLGNSPP